MHASTHVAHDTRPPQNKLKLKFNFAYIFVGILVGTASWVLCGNGCDATTRRDGGGCVQQHAAERSLAHVLT